VNNPHEYRPLLTAEQQERALKHFLLRQARGCGPSVARLLQTVWAENILEMVRECRELMELAQRYSPERLRAACRRAIYYRKDHNFYNVAHILDHQYDRLPLSPYTDIEGQFLFSLEPSADSSNNVESRIMRERKAV
jgi:hypothetical protein